MVEDNPAEQLSIRELLGYDDIDVDAWCRRERTRSKQCNEDKFDCVVLDLRLPDMSGFEVLEQLPRHAGAAAICRWLSSPARTCRRKKMLACTTLARSVVVKDVESPERLLDETALFLHRVVADLPAEKQRHARSPAPLRRRAGRDSKVLVVDDDVRNIFALSSVLERRGMTVLTAGTGREAIATIWNRRRTWQSC